MKNISNGALGFVQSSNSFSEAFLVKITPLSGQSFYLTDYGADLSWGSLPTDTNIYRTSKWGNWHVGDITSELSFECKSNSVNLTANISNSVMFPGTSTPMMQGILAGAMNGATVTISVIWFDSLRPLALAANQGAMQVWAGTVSSYSPIGRSQVVLKCNDIMHQLNAVAPLRQYQTTCTHTLFSPGCALSPASYTVSSSVVSSTNNTLINTLANGRANSHTYTFGTLIQVSGGVYFCSTAGTSAASAPTFTSTAFSKTNDGTAVWTCCSQPFFTLGTLKFTSGQNHGFTYSIASDGFSGNPFVQLNAPAYFPIANGDTFTLLPGCQKSIAYCQLFKNLIHISNTPFIPNPEQSI